MRQGIRDTFDQTETLLIRVDAGAAELKETQHVSRVKDLKEAWQETEAALIALSEYAGALAPLSAVGDAEDDEKSAKSLMGTVADIVGKLTPLDVPAKVVELVKIGEAELHKMRAAGSLRDAVQAADVWIQRLATILGENLDDLEAIADASDSRAEDQVETRHEGVKDYHPEFKTKSKEIILTSRRRLSEDDLEGLNRAIEMAAVVRSEEERYRPQHAAYEADKASIKALRKKAVGAAKKAKTSVSMWAATHAKLHGYQGGRQVQHRGSDSGRVRSS